MAFVPSEFSGAYDYVASKVATAEAAAQAYKAAADVNVLAYKLAAQQTKQKADDALDATKRAVTWAPWIAGGALALGAYYLHTRSAKLANPLAHTAARWLLLGGTVAGGTGAILTTGAAATLQPEVLALSGPLMVLGAVLVASSTAADNFDKSGTTP